MTWKGAGELQGGHRDAEGSCGGQSPKRMQGSWQHHCRDQGDIQGTGNAALGVLGYNGSITVHE